MREQHKLLDKTARRRAEPGVDGCIVVGAATIAPSRRHTQLEARRRGACLKPIHFIVEKEFKIGHVSHLPSTRNCTLWLAINATRDP